MNEIWNRIGRRKTGCACDWVVRKMEVLDDDSWLGEISYYSADVPLRFTMTTAEIWEEEALYEEETCNCAKCFGAGKIVSGWSRDTGQRYKECPRCGGSGLSKAREEHREEKCHGK